jgi:tRNA threonylcarbamoyladenosine biosynthesis protein TsaE
VIERAAVTVTVGSADETRALGEAVGALVEPGDVVVLAGDLGAGKTTLTQGLARRLGVSRPVTSPTFTLVHEYQGSVPVVHLDVYRLGHLQEVHDLGFDDFLGGDAVVVIEWGDVVAPLLPPDRLEIVLRYCADAVEEPDARTAELAGVGERWAVRAAALEAAARAAVGAP